GAVLGEQRSGQGDSPGRQRDTAKKLTPGGRESGKRRKGLATTGAATILHEISSTPNQTYPEDAGHPHRRRPKPSLDTGPKTVLRRQTIAPRVGQCPARGLPGPRRDQLLTHQRSHMRMLSFGIS